MAKIQAVRSMTNMMTLSTIMQSGGSLQDVDNAEQIEEGVSHLGKSLHKLLNSDGGQFHWKQEMDLFYKSWSKLVLDSNDSVYDTDISFGQLNDYCTKIILNGKMFPTVITQKKKEEPPAKQVEEVQQEE